jgi:hypothetical protein
MVPATDRLRATAQLVYRRAECAGQSGGIGRRRSPRSAQPSASARGGRGSAPTPRATASPRWRPPAPAPGRRAVGRARRRREARAGRASRLPLKLRTAGAAPPRGVNRQPLNATGTFYAAPSARSDLREPAWQVPRPASSSTWKPANRAASPQPRTLSTGSPCPSPPRPRPPRARPSAATAATVAPRASASPSTTKRAATARSSSAGRTPNAAAASSAAARAPRTSTRAAWTTAERPARRPP